MFENVKTFSEYSNIHCGLTNNQTDQVKFICLESPPSEWLSLPAVVRYRVPEFPCNKIVFTLV